MRAFLSGAAGRTAPETGDMASAPIPPLTSYLKRDERRYVRFAGGEGLEHNIASVKHDGSKFVEGAVLKTVLKLVEPIDLKKIKTADDVKEARENLKAQVPEFRLRKDAARKAAEKSPNEWFYYENSTGYWSSFLTNVQRHNEYKLTGEDPRPPPRNEAKKAKKRTAAAAFGGQAGARGNESLVDESDHEYEYGDARSESGASTETDSPEPAQAQSAQAVLDGQGASAEAASAEGRGLLRRIRAEIDMLAGGDREEAEAGYAALKRDFFKNGNALLERVKAKAAAEEEAQLAAAEEEAQLAAAAMLNKASKAKEDYRQARREGGNVDFAKEKRVVTSAAAERIAAENPGRIATHFGFNNEFVLETEPGDERSTRKVDLLVVLRPDDTGTVPVLVLEAKPDTKSTSVDTVLGQLTVRRHSIAAAGEEIRNKIGAPAGNLKFRYIAAFPKAPPKGAASALREAGFETWVVSSRE